MSRSWYLRTALLVFLILFSCVILMPTVVEMMLYPESKDDVAEEVMTEEPVRNPPLPQWYQDLPGWMKQKTLSLGLDLQGGLMLRYSVDVDSALNDKMSSNAGNIRSALAGMGKEITAVRHDRALKQLNFTFRNEEDTKIITEEFLYDYPMLAIVKTEGSTITLGLRENTYKESEESAVQQAVEIIRDRIDGLGVAQPTVRVESGRNIAVELPGLSRSRVAAAERLISTTAVLTFKLVADRNEAIAVFTNLSQKVTPDSGIYVGGGTLRADDVVDPATRRVIKTGKEILKDFVRANEQEIPSGREVDYEKVDLRERRMEVADDVDVNTLPQSWRMRLVRTDMPPLSGENVEAAYPASNPDTGMPYVSLKLDRIGGDTFYEITKQHVGDQLAILMDDTLVSDPVIRSEIPGGNVSIEMGRGNRQDTLTEVNNLVVSLRSGALPAPIRQEYKTLVGPSLGADSIKTGMEALAVGFVLVFLVMLYYQTSGLIADFALLCNVLFILAGMASMGAALTMPGIAGIILTVGMAVDSNVIVFERIREELRMSETPRKAIHIGYDKALWTILDSNITTAVAAIVLMNFGSGPVKGFAITLLLGIIATVYTAFFVSKTIFELKVRISPDKISI